MNNKTIFSILAVLITIFALYKCYYTPQKHTQISIVNMDEYDSILPPAYYLYPTFNHLRPVRQRGEYFYFPQASRL